MNPRGVTDFSVCLSFYLLLGQSGDLQVLYMRKWKTPHLLTCFMEASFSHWGIHVAEKAFHPPDSLVLLSLGLAAGHHSDIPVLKPADLSPDETL